MNRRAFGRAAAATGIFSASFSRILAADFDYPWKLGVITDEVDLDLAHVLASFYPKYQLKWAEIRNLELNGKSSYVYKDATPAQLKQIRHMLDDAGVSLSVLDSAVYKIALPGTTPIGANAADLNPAAGEYHRQLEDLKRAASAAHTLGTERVRIFTFKRVPDPSSVFSRVVDELGKAIAVAKQENITLVVENEFDCNVGTGSETRQLFAAIPDRRLMHNWDPGNCFEAGEQPFPKAWDQLDHTRIVHIHLKDAAGKDWKPIGGGEIDFAGQFQALKRINYSGTMSLETHYKNAQHDLYASSVESMDGLFKVLRQV